MRPLVVLLISMLLSSVAMANSIACSALFSDKTPLSESGQRVLEEVKISLAKEILNPDPLERGGHLVSRIGWNSLNSLDNLTSEIESYGSYVRALTQKEILSEAKAWSQARSELADLEVQVFERLRNLNQRGQYKPGEYNLIRSSFLRLILSLKELPKELRPEISRPGRDLRESILNKAGVAIVNRIERQARKVFTNSFDGKVKNYTEFKKLLRENDDPHVKRAFKIIEGDQIDLTIRRPESARFWVPRVGFQNQFVTGSSKGSLTADYRNLTESVRTNARDLESYSSLDPEIKPKYGSLRFKADDIVEAHPTATQYGPDIYVIKKKAVQDRLTFTTTNSLYLVDSTHRAPPRKDGSFKALSLNELFIPWSQRFLMVPFMIYDIAQKQWSIPQRTDDFALTPSGMRAGVYWEIQVFGKLDLSMIEQFEFTGTPPQGEFVKSLQRHNIKIIDARNGERKVWEPEA